jgi:glycosyltransferase involved in cell wall biosynthesis
VTSLGVFVGDGGDERFFSDICADLRRAFRVDVFSHTPVRMPVIGGRVNRWAYVRRIDRMLRSHDVCFFEWASELLVEACRLPKASRIVARLHSYEVHVWAPHVRWEHVDRIVFVSSYVRRLFCEAYPAHAARTELIHNGVDLARFRPGPDRQGTLHLGMLGALHPVKRVYDVIPVVAELRALGLRPHLHVGGGRVSGGHFDGYAVATHRLVEKLGLTDCVTFHGTVDHPDQWLRHMDVFLSNSYWEGQQVALLEALASGCYCLAHGWDGVEDVLPPDQIVLTPTQLRDRIVSFAALSAAGRREARRAARALACERFDIEDTKQRVHRVVRDVASGVGLDTGLQPCVSGSTLAS